MTVQAPMPSSRSRTAWTSGKRGVISHENGSGCLCERAQHMISTCPHSITDRPGKTTYTTTPASTSAFGSGVISCPCASRALRMSSAHRAVAILMKITWFAKFRPTHTLRMNARVRAVSVVGVPVREQGPDPPLPEAVGDMSKPMCVRWRDVSSARGVKEALRAEDVRVRVDVRIVVHAPDVRDDSCAFRNEVPFVPVILGAQLCQPSGMLAGVWCFSVLTSLVHRGTAASRRLVSTRAN